MKQIVLFLLVFFPFAFPTYAQTEATTIETMNVELWPDYDRPAVLVLLTGTFPTETALPAAVTVPLSNEATLNVVARITPEGNLVDDIEVTHNNGSITFVVPNSRFRVEYYQPYTAENDQHSFTFSWLADLSVNEWSLTVQQPVFATALETEPTAVDIFQNGSDGFTYHALPTQNIPASESYTARLTYTMNPSRLSIEQLPNALAVETVAPAILPAASSLPAFDWPLLLVGIGGFLITIAVTWQLATYRASRKAAFPLRKSTNQQATKPTNAAARFCHECGTPLRNQDRFCRECGTAVKTKKPN